MQGTAPMREVVLDTNVLVTGLRSRRGASYRLISLIGTGVFGISISVALALEYEEVLKRAGLIPLLSGAAADAFPEYIFQASNLVPSVHSIRPSLSIRTMNWSWSLRHSAERRSLRTIKGTLPGLRSGALVF